MRETNLFAAGAVALSLLGAASGAQAQTFSNGPAVGTIAPFGFPQSGTYGEVFTAQVSGSLTNFTMYLTAGIGGTLYGGIGAWNCGSTFTLGCGVDSILYQSAGVAADHGGAYSFAPNITLTSGVVYVAFLSVIGADNTGQGTTSMQTANGGVGFDYFVWNNTGGPDDASWDYFADISTNQPGGDARLDLTYEPLATVPEPAAWALMILGFGSVGAAVRRRRALTAVA